jgi:hypothetical protein
MGSSGGGGGGGGDSRNEVRYAPYIENYHSAFLAQTASSRTLALTDSPYEDFTDVEVDDAFFGAGYTIASFPSLYDMYGKFMAGLDIEALWDQMYSSTINNSEVTDLVSAESSLMDDEIEEKILPRFQLGMRDINAVMTSSYIVGKSLIESAKVKTVEKFSAELKYRMIPIAQDRWAKHLAWNEGVIKNYIEVMKTFYVVKSDIDEQNYKMHARDVLWPFTVLDFEKANLGAMQGAVNTSGSEATGSTASKALGGALSGAASGAMIGSAVPGIGTAVGAGAGALVGGLAGLFG